MTYLTKPPSCKGLNIVSDIINESKMRSKINIFIALLFLFSVVGTAVAIEILEVSKVNTTPTLSATEKSHLSSNGISDPNLTDTLCDSNECVFTMYDTDKNGTMILNKEIRYDAYKTTGTNKTVLLTNAEIQIKRNNLVELELKHMALVFQTRNSSLSKTVNISGGNALT